jgi:antibiotic biosynthesis monooxygenase (ABM) superfamily enzyme
MIARIWHGWTSKVNADKYWDILSNQVLPGIANMKINGYQGVKVLKRSVGNEEEFITIMEFDSLDSVRQFVGED